MSQPDDTEECVTCPPGPDGKKKACGICPKCLAGFTQSNPPQQKVYPKRKRGTTGEIVIAHYRRTQEDSSKKDI